MIFKEKVLAYFHNILWFFSKIPRIWAYIKLIYRYFFRFGTDNNFILRIAPLHDKKHDSYRNYFPPPCYGFPYGKEVQSTKPPIKPYQKYGLFIWPDRLYQDIFYFFILFY